MKEFGFIEAEAEECSPEEDGLLNGRAGEGEEPTSLTVNRTKSGRHVRPPKHILTDRKQLAESQEAKVEETLPASFASPFPFLEFDAVPTKQRWLAKKYTCQVCGKLYPGPKKMARHLKVFMYFLSYIGSR